VATVNIGNLTFTHRGDYASGTAYVKNDVVYYATNGNAYIAKQATTGNAPTNGTYWSQFAAGSGGIWNAGLSLGSGSQQLRVNSSGNALEFFTPTVAAQNVDIVNYTAFDGTGVNTHSVTTNWATNNYWKMEIFCQYQMNANQGSKFRLRNASGDITSATYSHVGYYTHCTESHNNDSLALHRDANGGLDAAAMNGWGFNSARMNPNVQVNLFKPDPNGRQSWTLQYYNNDTSGSVFHANYHDYFWTSDTSAKTGYSIYGNSSANFINGFVITLGYKYQ